MVSLKVESWTWWSVVMLVALSRFVSRRMILGAFRKFQADDYVMIVVLCFYTTLIATINIVRNTNSNLLPPGFDVNTLTPQDKAERVYGSKLILVVEQCQCVTVWGAKLCLIILYLRLTTMQKENIAIKALLAYVIGSFILMDILYFGVWCQPFHNYWAVPTPSRQCDAATDHLITNATFNLTSDICLMAIGLPMFLRLNLPMRKKLPLVVIFSLGFFTIVAAVLNKYYSFTHPFGAQWTYWYVRESSTSLLVTNLPFVWTIWRKISGIEKTIVGQSKAGTCLSGTLDDTNRAIPDATPPPSAHLKTAEEWLAEDDMDEEKAAPLQQQRMRNLSFADMLSESRLASSDAAEQDPNPVTHPAIFYSRNKRPTKKASTFPRSASVGGESLGGDGGEEVELTQRVASMTPDAHQHDTPSSSTFPASMKSRTSAGSFV